MVAVDEGGPRDLIEDGRTGLLRPADSEALAAGMLALAASPTMRRQLGRSALAAVRQRSWERSLAQLAEGYARVLDAAADSAGRVAA